MSDETSVVRTIGRYHAVDELGRGGMGVVYRAFDPVIGRTVALKTIGFVSLDAEAKQLRERLYREASAAGTLTHANIVTVYDVVEDGNTTAVAMEFVEGRTLGQLLAEQGPLPLDRAVTMFEQICAALDYAGSRGIVHRDIKPANILITADGHIKITDFGIARMSFSGLTQTGTIMGSPSYMSPEQVRGVPLDPRSDLFSAAVVFYELVTGERPFGGDDVATTMYRIVNEPPRAVNLVNPSISPAVSTVLERALAKDPAARFQTGRELAAALRQAIDVNLPELTSAYAPVVLPPPAPLAPPKRSPIVLVGGIGIALLAVAAVVIMFSGSGSDQTRDVPAEPSEETSGVEIAPASGGGVEFAPPVATASAPAVPLPAPTQPTYSGPVSTMPPPAGTPPATPPTGSGGVADRPPPRNTTPADGAAPASTQKVWREERQASAPDTRPPATIPVASPPPPSPPPPSPPVRATASEAIVRFDYEGEAYPVTVFNGDTRLGRIDGAGSALALPPGTVTLRLVGEAVFLNAELATMTLNAGDRRTVPLPGSASAVLSVRGEEYTGVRLMVDGRQVPGPYPAQVPRLAAGAHRVTYRWISGPRAGRDISTVVTVSAGGHYLIRAVPDNEEIVVQQLR